MLLCPFENSRFILSFANTDLFFRLINPPGQLLQYFRINDPYRLLGLLVILVLLSLILLVDGPVASITEVRDIGLGAKIREGFSPYNEIVDRHAPLMAWFDGATHVVFGNSITGRRVFALVLLFLQCGLWGIVLISRKAFEENTYVPSFIFMALLFYATDNFALSGELIGALFMLGAINNLFKVIEFRAQRDETLFNLGLLVSLASLFALPYSLFILTILLCMRLYARVAGRSYVMVLFGFLLPHLLIAIAYWMTDSFGRLWSYYYLPTLTWDHSNLLTAQSWGLLAVPGIFLLMALFVLGRDARFTKYQGQLLQTMFLWLATSVAVGFVTFNIRPQSFICAVAPVCYFVTHHFLLIRRKRIAEMLTLLLVFGLVGVLYLTRYGLLFKRAYDGVFVSGAHPLPQYEDKKLLILAPDRDGLAMKNPGSLFLDWKLTEDLLSNPGYYDNLNKVYSTLKKDPPDVIVDKKNLLAPFLKQIADPSLNYVKQGDTYQRKASN